MILFLLFTPSLLVARAQDSFVDARFVRKEEPYRGSILIYHIVRHRPYSGSLTQWLKGRAEAYEKKHKGLYFEIEGMDENAYRERLEHGRRPDAYSFFSGSVYEDRIKAIPYLDCDLKEGLFQTERCVPYCFSGYLKLMKTPDGASDTVYCVNDILAARTGLVSADAPEDKADVLYLDFRRAGDLVRYKEGYALASYQPIDHFTDAVCWMGIDRDTDDEKAKAINAFIAFLLEPESQETLSALGLMSVRRDVRDISPDPGLKQVYKTYETVRTVDPFRWYSEYDALLEDAGKAEAGDADALARFTNRLNECCR